MPVDLTSPAVRSKLAAQIKSDIDKWCQDTFDDGPRKHLGASIIGADCRRALQYSFRWMHYTVVSGRMQRLFNRGHREEERFVGYLRGIGFDIWQYEDEAAGRQYRCKAIDGHFGGSLDGINQAPARYDIGEPMLCEFKTNGTGKTFSLLLEKGVRLAHPKHYIQMCTYGKFYKLKFGLYLNTCKNDDDIHIEIVELDWSLAEDYQRKAAEIIKATMLLPGISVNPTDYRCKTCDFLGICHHGHAPMRNCRSCKHSRPIAEGAWQCGLNGQTIPDDFVAKGCGAWTEFGK